MQPPNQEAVFRIQHATATDAPAIAAVLRRSFLEFEPLYTAQGFAATILSAELVQGRLQEGPIWIALRNREIVATASVVVKPRGIYVRGMAVLPAARGLGIAEALLREVESFARSNGATLMYLSTTPFLHAAIKLYENSGFQRADDPPHHLFGTPLFTMVKSLGR